MGFGVGIAISGGGIALIAAGITALGLEDSAKGVDYSSFWGIAGIALIVVGALVFLAGTVVMYRHRSQRERPTPPKRIGIDQTGGTLHTRRGSIVNQDTGIRTKDTRSDIEDTEIS